MSSDLKLYGTYTKQTGKLTVSKTITGAAQSFLSSIPDANKTFPFTLSGTSASGEPYSKEFKVVAGKSVTISDIPVGTYTLTESYGSKWWTYTSTNPQTVTITNGGTATASFTNKIATGKLTVTKKLANIEAGAIRNAEDKKFKFTLYSTSAYQTSVNETKELTGSGSVTFSEIPVGTYTLKVSNKKAYVGKTTKISAKATKGARLSYKTSNKKIATVSSKGVITGKKTGTVKITITAKRSKYKTVKKTITVKVYVPPEPEGHRIKCKTDNGPEKEPGRKSAYKDGL